MRTHQRLIATAAMAVGAALLSPTAVCAEGGVRAAAPSGLLEFGGAAVPEDTASVVALRAPADAGASDMEEVAGGRRLMWWNWVANMVHPVCGPLHHGPECQDLEEAEGDSSGGSSGSSGSGGNDDGSGSRSSGSDVEGSGGASGSNSQIMSPTPASMTALVAAAMAAGTAIAAAVIGSRRRKTGTAHPLQGSVKNRMRLFGAFADRNLVSKTERPCGRVVEMSSPPIVEDAHYNEMA